MTSHASPEIEQELPGNMTANSALGTLNLSNLMLHAQANGLNIAADIFPMVRDTRSGPLPQRSSTPCLSLNRLQSWKSLECLLVVGRILGGSPAVVRPLVNFFRFDGLGLVTMIISFPDLFVDFFLRFDLDDVGAVKLSVEKASTYIPIPSVVIQRHVSTVTILTVEVRDSVESRLASSLQGVEMRTRVRLNVAARTEGLRDMRSVGCGWMCTRRGRMRIDGRVVVREVGSLEAQMTLQDERALFPAVEGRTLIVDHQTKHRGPSVENLPRFVCKAEGSGSGPWIVVRSLRVPETGGLHGHDEETAGSNSKESRVVGFDSCNDYQKNDERCKKSEASNAQDSIVDGTRGDGFENGFEEWSAGGCTSRGWRDGMSNVGGRVAVRDDGGDIDGLEGQSTFA
ncbi:hypothetical protein EDD18DRAFT_1099731 [Armillaria luteobubalina]|uniref:Uncharacterized protein n=1 Tax=Armillaria luteobubalina TaxID=153913 RepID=A0AA39QJ90_9AGAR|nr:hypothetical protein EDD18DRAFT_1099731 [Armillaria luteobubalina]